MYIEPNSELILLSNCPLDTTYEHTLYFENKTEQYNYFMGLKKRTFDGQSYIRKSKGVVHLEILADKIYDCNYMMFRNTSYGNKWFYAFITNVEYVSNTSCYVTFVVDFMQTWFLDCRLKQSFVEREHSVTDVVGENTLPENVELGSYITTIEKFVGGEYNEEQVDNLGVCILATGLPDDLLTVITNLSEPPKIITGNPLACYSIILPLTYFVEKMKSIADSFARDTSGNEIVAIFTFPPLFVHPSDTNVTTIEFGNFDLSLPINVKNNKLKTYPYCCLTVTGSGQTCELKYELFNGKPRFKTYSTLQPDTKVVCVPENYEGESENFNYVVNLSGYPILSWINDGYQQFIAQNSSALETSINNAERSANANVGSSLVGLTRPNPTPYGAILNFGADLTNTATSNINAISNVIAKITDSHATPDTLMGEYSGRNAITLAKKNCFRIRCRTIRPEYLRIIDEYFDKFGYSTKRNKIPNISSRPHWNYTKTIGCVLVGNAPADDINAICKCFDNGITFWKNGDEVGNYNLDNTV